MLNIQDTKEILQALHQLDVQVVTFLPESMLKPLYTYLLSDDTIEHVIPVPNESTGITIAAGAWMGGKRSVMIMENSGLRVASEALARLGLPLQIPVVFFMSYRGDLGEENWWGVNHAITMEPMLQAMRIPYRIVRDSSSITPSIKWAFTHAQTSMYHTAVIFGRELMQ